MDLNKIQLIGRVGQPPKLRYTKSDTPVIGFSIATNHTYDGNEETTWHDITAFGRLAELVDEYVDVGDEIYVEGRISKSEWTDDAGQTRKSTEVIAKNIQFDSSGSGGSGSSKGSHPPSNTPPVDEYDDDEIPF